MVSRDGKVSLSLVLAGLGIAAILGVAGWQWVVVHDFQVFGSGRSWTPTEPQQFKGRFNEQGIFVREGEPPLYPTDEEMAEQTGNPDWHQPLPEDPGPTPQ
jgi:hypothetical protein